MWLVSPRPIPQDLTIPHTNPQHSECILGESAGHVTFCQETGWRPHPPFTWACAHAHAQAKGVTWLWEHELGLMRMELRGHPIPTVLSPRLSLAALGC